MKTDTDLASLGNDKLVTLVQQLRRQLAERDQEIERLKRLLPTGEAPTMTEDAAPAIPAEPDSGTEEDLLAQLEKIYPEGR